MNLTNPDSLHLTSSGYGLPVWFLALPPAKDVDLDRIVWDVEYREATRHLWRSDT